MKVDELILQKEAGLKQDIKILKALKSNPEYWTKKIYMGDKAKLGEFKAENKGTVMPSEKHYADFLYHLDEMKNQNPDKIINKASDKIKGLFGKETSSTKYESSSKAIDDHINNLENILNDSRKYQKNETENWDHMKGESIPYDPGMSFRNNNNYVNTKKIKYWVPYTGSPKDKIIKTTEYLDRTPNQFLKDWDDSANSGVKRALKSNKKVFRRYVK